MTSEFDSERARLSQELDEARRNLKQVLSNLRPTDLQKSRRGGWTVLRVIDHVVESEGAYARLATRLRLATPSDSTKARPLITSFAAALLQLDSSRAALLSAIEGVDEDAFYRLAAVGHEEYSVLSVVENVVSHDREHAGQIQAIAAGPARPTR